MLGIKPVSSLHPVFEHIELPAKLLDYLLRSNKSNINQSISYHFAVGIVAL